MKTNDSSATGKVLILAETVEGYGHVFSSYGTLTYYPQTVAPTTRLSIAKLKEFSLIVFAGGPDIDPKYYGQAKEPRTYCSTDRDKRELAIFKTAKRAGIPMVGICRGAQLGTVANGFCLQQHVEGHSHNGAVTEHKASVNIDDVPFITFAVRGEHHQIMLPHKVQDKLKCNPSNYVSIARADDYTHEIVWYPDSKFLAVQFHPEWMGIDDEAVRIFRGCITQYVLNRGDDALKYVVNSILDKRTQDAKTVLNFYNNGGSAQQATLAKKVYDAPATCLGDTNNE